MCCKEDNKTYVEMLFRSAGERINSLMDDVSSLKEEVDFLSTGMQSISSAAGKEINTIKERLACLEEAITSMTAGTIQRTDTIPGGDPAPGRDKEKEK